MPLPARLTSNVYLFPYNDDWLNKKTEPPDSRFSSSLSPSQKRAEKGIKTHKILNAKWKRRGKEISGIIGKC